MRSLTKGFFIHLRFFKAIGIIITVFILAFPYPIILPFAKALVVIFLSFCVLDALILFKSKAPFIGSRELPRIMSLGNEIAIYLELKNESNLTYNLTVIDELPYQFQQRNNRETIKLDKGETKKLKRYIRPVTRGIYQFGNVQLFMTSSISLIERKYTLALEKNVPVYPSILDVKKYELHASTKLNNYLGIKKIRRLGHSYEFEQVSEYNQGDNYQHINWKATSKTRKLMINRYTDEKSQPIYSVIDKSRYMKMPFNDLTLLDYSINASLVISNSVLRKDDKAGLITFSDTIESHIRADRRRDQLGRILETLYKESETKVEANYERLYTFIQKQVATRGLLLLFSNFDTVYALERVMPVLRKLNKIHLLVVIVFENTELEEFYNQTASNMQDIYDHTIARKVASEKQQVIYQLRQYGIQVVYTKPENLSLDTLNKYLELKSRGMI